MKLKTIIQIFISAAVVAAMPVNAAEATARITKVWTEKETVVVQVQTTGPVLKVTLESSPRVGRRSWEPRAVRYLTNGEPENVEFTFAVPLSPRMEILRVHADLVDQSLPASFYQGTNSFVTGSQGPGGNRAVLENAAPTADAAGAGGGDDRAVVESDIWKLDDDRLFFFNQNRGLQAIDVSNPDQPVITGTYDVAASGGIRVFAPCTAPS